MPQQTVAQVSVADNLCQLAKEFESGDKVMAQAIRKEFKSKSFNDVTRAVVYLMEVIGSRDEQYKILQKENSDLREILKLNNISLDGEGRTEKNDDTKADQSNNAANTGDNQSVSSSEVASVST